MARDSLASYANEVFRAIPRVDQRRWAEVYLRGLLSVEGKKSVRKIAENILSAPAHQSLQQFINQSPWRWAPVRAGLARYLQGVEPPRAWLVNRVVIPKRGDRSVGVERQFLPEAGRTVNCQLGLAVSLVGATSNVPVNWRILLPRTWDSPATRKAAHIPDHVEIRPEWRETAAMVREMSERWGLRQVPVVANARHLGRANELVAELSSCGVPFVLEVGESLGMSGAAHLLPRRPPHSSLPRRSLERVLTARASLHPLTGQPREQQCQERQRQKQALTQRNHTLAPVAPAPRRSFVRSSMTRIPATNGSPPRVARLLTEISSSGEATRFWITSLMDHRIDDIMSLARLDSRTREDMQNLEQHFGLRDFEGRSFRGWHHHMTMVSAAYIFANVGWRAPAMCAS
ncbi:IS701 family transposase [Streptomyces sp. 4N509B]|uniref:IS701 family transposase n=1 Tax=Streptomyces sp. 4N509B TaxID=3457413 RepID=UPI003FCFF624